VLLGSSYCIPIVDFIINYNLIFLRLHIIRNIRSTNMSATFCPVTREEFKGEVPGGAFLTPEAVCRNCRNIAALHTLSSTTLVGAVVTPTIDFQIAPVDPNSINNIDSWIDTPYHNPNQLIPTGHSWDADTSNATSTNEALTRTINNWLHEPCGHGEDSQHGRNDGLFKLMMRLASLPDSSFMRNLHVASTVGTTRPDFSALHNNVPVFFAEEKEGDNLQGAIADVLTKFAWIPNLMRLPFFITFAVCFSQFAVIIWRRDMHPTQRFYPISTLVERLAVLKKMINIAGVVRYIVLNQLIIPSTLTMNEWHDRQNGKQIRLNSRGMELKCSDVRYPDLLNFYNACKATRASRASPARDSVPFIERLNDYFAPNPAENTRHFFLVPIGAPVQPASLHEFCHAIICVVTAIWGIHERGWMHTDIRWSNIVKIDYHIWYLIDCYEACREGSHHAQKRGEQAHLGHSWTIRDDRNQIGTLFQFADPNIIVTLQDIRDSIVEGLALPQITANLQDILQNVPNVPI